MRRRYPNTLGWRPDASMIETQERVCERVFRNDFGIATDAAVLVASSEPKRAVRSMDWGWTVTVEAI